MVDRYRIWLGAGVLAGGMSAAMLAGAGVAAAEDGAPSSTGSQASAGAEDETSEKTENTKAGEEADEENSDEKAEDEKAEDENAEDENAEDENAEDEKAEDEKADGDAADGGAEPVEDAGSDSDAEPDEPEVDPDEPEADADVDAPAGDAEPDVSPEPPASEMTTETVPAQDDDFAGTPSPFVTSVETDLSSREGSAVMQFAAVESPGIVSELVNLLDKLNDIGSALYNMYTGAMQFLAGPARAPFGSRVRVESSTLEIGDGVVVPADWYFPPGNSEPKGLIYLQHGMLATSAFYGATAAYLAEKTDSIVVVPTLTWNIFDVSDYPLMLSHTHEAIAALFSGDREALNASAELAGYTKTLPTKVVLVGHSAGGGLVVGTARYMVERGLAADLAGVVMLDGGGLGGGLSQDLAKIPESIPVYNLAADPDTWNNYGDATRRLQQARPDAFTGIVVLGGRHSDAMQSCSPLVQMAAYFATGFSAPWNIAINQVLAAGWIGDMLDGTRTPGLYGWSGLSAKTATVSLSTGSAAAGNADSRASGDVCVDSDPGSLCASLPGPKPARLTRIAV